MEFIRGLCNLRPSQKVSVCTIGAFDGVHLGHQQVLRQLCRSARKHKAESVVLTFDPLPREFFALEQAPPRICNIHDKSSMLRAHGVDRLLCVRFNAQLSKVPAADFIIDVFVNRLNMRCMVVGDDLRFGHQQQGDFNLLNKLGEDHQFTVERASTYKLDGSRVSSTRIRKTLAKADFGLAEQLLGYPYNISGKVVKGRCLGRELGFPTANIALHHYRCALSGVYAVEVTHRDWPEALPAVANIGVRPTLSRLNKVFLETHILDYDGDLYNQRLKVRFVRKLRAERRFESVEALRAQISKDVKMARACFS
jgi:riboflavin kinase/FMN adenylyltransferase